MPNSLEGPQISRGTFLKGAGVVGAGLAVVACSPRERTPLENMEGLDSTEMDPTLVATPTPTLVEGQRVDKAEDIVVARPVLSPTPEGVSQDPLRFPMLAEIRMDEVNFGEEYLLIDPGAEDLGLDEETLKRIAFDENTREQVLIEMRQQAEALQSLGSDIDVYFTHNYDNVESPDQARSALLGFKQGVGVLWGHVERDGEWVPVDYPGYFKFEENAGWALDDVIELDGEEVVVEHRVLEGAENMVWAGTRPVPVKGGVEIDGKEYYEEVFYQGEWQVVPEVVGEVPSDLTFEDGTVVQENVSRYGKDEASGLNVALDEEGQVLAYQLPESREWATNRFLDTGYEWNIEMEDGRALLNNIYAEKWGTETIRKHELNQPQLFKEADLPDTFYFEGEEIPEEGLLAITTENDDIIMYYDAERGRWNYAGVKYNPVPGLEVRYSSTMMESAGIIPEPKDDEERWRRVWASMHWFGYTNRTGNQISFEQFYSRLNNGEDFQYAVWAWQENRETGEIEQIDLLVSTQGTPLVTEYARRSDELQEHGLINASLPTNPVFSGRSGIGLHALPEGLRIFGIEVWDFHQRENKWGLWNFGLLPIDVFMMNALGAPNSWQKEGEARYFLQNMSDFEKDFLAGIGSVLLVDVTEFGDPDTPGEYYSKVDKLVLPPLQDSN